MVIDIILAVVLLIAAIYGYKKGCIKIVMKIVSVIAAMVLAYFLCNTAGDYLYNKMGLGEKVKTSVESSLTGYISNNGTVNEDTLNIIKKVQAFLGMEKSNDTKSLTERITGYVFTGIGFAVVFILVRIIFMIASIMLDGVFSLPILKSFNELGGAIASVILMGIKIWIALAIINFMAPLEFMSGIMKLINSSVITNFMYEHNIINMFIIKRII